MLTNLQKSDTIFCLSPLSNIKKQYLQISKCLFHTNNNFKGNNLNKQTILIKTIIQIDKHKVKYIIIACIPIIIINSYFFFLLYIRTNGKSINFDNKNIKKTDFYNKNKKIFNIDDIDVNIILVSKKEQCGKYKSPKYFYWV